MLPSLEPALVAVPMATGVSLSLGTSHPLGTLGIRADMYKTPGPPGCSCYEQHMPPSGSVFVGEEASPGWCLSLIPVETSLLEERLRPVLL